MNTWKDILQASITEIDDLISFSENLTGYSDKRESINNLPMDFPMRINPYYFNLIKKIGDPIWQQCIPSKAEQEDQICMIDPLAEEEHSPVKNLVHKYSNRALLLVTGQCAVFCRFCTRKRSVGTSLKNISDKELDDCLDYLRRHHEIREVLISGGDPLLLEDERIDYILSKIYEIPNIDIIRIGSRVPCTLPMRITKNLVNILQKYHPLYFNTHFNHPNELTEESKKACTMLANAGIPLGNQTVLLKGINDDHKVLSELFNGLLKMRVKPYYLFQADLTRGTNHFRTHSSVGIKIMENLYGYLSGMAIPRLALDAPEGKGKIPLSPNYVIERGDNLIFKNYLGEQCSYPEMIEIDN